MDTENKFRVTGSSQVSLDQDAVLKIGIAKVGIYQGCASQVGIPHTNVSQINIDPTRLNQASGSKISLSQIDINELALHHESTAKVSFTQVGSQNSDTLQRSSNQVNAVQINILQHSTQLNASEIPLPSSITLQQFLSSHNFNLQNTTIPTWTEFLTGTTPFNLKIEITDLPTGHLAGLISGNYDDRVQLINGTPTFQGNGYSTPLTADRSYLTDPHARHHQRPQNITSRPTAHPMVFVELPKFQQTLAQDDRHEPSLNHG
jgi:hypothetical protein